MNVGVFFLSMNGPHFDLLGAESPRIYSGFSEINSLQSLRKVMVHRGRLLQIPTNALGNL